MCPAEGSASGTPCGGVYLFCPVNSSYPRPIPSGQLGSCDTPGSCDAATLSSLSSCPSGFYCSYGTAEACGGVDAYCPVNASGVCAVPWRVFFVVVSLMLVCRTLQYRYLYPSATSRSQRQARLTRASPKLCASQGHIVKVVGASCALEEF